MSESVSTKTGIEAENGAGPSESEAMAERPPTQIGAAKHGRASYTETERRAGLGALALCSGNGRKAEALLERAGQQRIPHRTLYQWRHSQADLYREIRDGAVAKIKADAAEVYTDLSAALIEDAATLREHMAEKVSEIPGRDLPGAIRNVLTGAAIATDKAATLRDEPTAIVQHRSSAEVIRKLRAIGAIESEAEDVTDAEVCRARRRRPRRLSEAVGTRPGPHTASDPAFIWGVGPKDIRFTASDARGRTVVLQEDRWEHICAEHREVREQNLKHAVETADMGKDRRYLAT